MAPTINGVTYADDYEAITGKQLPTVETKVVTAPEAPEVATTVQAEVA